jgi:hypothetical protein
LHEGWRMSDSGHEAVGHALLITGVSVGALSAAELAGIAVHGIERLMAVLG